MRRTAMAALLRVERFLPVSLLDATPRIVGVDVGTKRVGIARSDPLHVFSQVHGTFSPDKALEELARMHEEEGISHVVVGWPLSLDGEENESTEFVDQFVEKIEEAVPGVSVTRQDERFSSEIAIGALREAGVHQPGRHDKGRVDAAAAAVILQDFLDA